MPFSSSDLQKQIQSETTCRPGFSPDAANKIVRYGANVGSFIEYIESDSRLMSRAKEQIKSFEKRGDSYPSGMVYFADELHSGKGRFSRSWHAPKGGIWMTLVLVNTLLPESFRLLPLAAGAACCEAVRSFSIEANVKWVNDIHLQGQKIAGILTETFVGPVYGEEYILLGIGLNVNNHRFPEELQGRACSMSMISGTNYDLDHVRLQLLAKLAWNIGLLHFVEDSHLETLGINIDDNKPHPLISSWRNLSDTPGKDVHFGFNVMEKIQYSASVIDVDNSGSLVMQLADGAIVKENSGEIIYA